jgi:hypothetical protein
MRRISGGWDLCRLPVLVPEKHGCGAEDWGRFQRKLERSSLGWDRSGRAQCTVGWISPSSPVRPSTPARPAPKTCPSAQPFVTQHYWADQASINPFRVVGTRHPDYQSLAWLELLEQGKRMPLNLRLHASNPGYYDETAKKQPEMSYLSLDGVDWYVNADGDHRTCIARFAFHHAGRSVLHGGRLDDYRADHALAGAFARLRELAAERRLGLRVETRREALGREDTAGRRHIQGRGPWRCRSGHRARPAASAHHALLQPPAHGPAPRRAGAVPAGMRVRYLMYPRTGVNSTSYEKAVSAWCAGRDGGRTSGRRGRYSTDPWPPTCGSSGRAWACCRGGQRRCGAVKAIAPLPSTARLNFILGSTA